MVKLLTSGRLLQLSCLELARRCQCYVAIYHASTPPNFTLSVLTVGEKLEQALGLRDEKEEPRLLFSRALRRTGIFVFCTKLTGFSWSLHRFFFFFAVLPLRLHLMVTKNILPAE